MMKTFEQVVTHKTQINLNHVISNIWFVDNWWHSDYCCASNVFRRKPIYDALIWTLSFSSKSLILSQSGHTSYTEHLYKHFIEVTVIETVNNVLLCFKYPNKFLIIISMKKITKVAFSAKKHDKIYDFFYQLSGADMIWFSLLLII